MLKDGQMYGNRIKDMGQSQDQSLSLRQANMGLEDDLMKCTLQPFLFFSCYIPRKKFMMIRVEHAQVIISETELVANLGLWGFSMDVRNYTR
jgi:hypothetical protein